MLGILWFLFWQVCGILTAGCLFRGRPLPVRIWLGSVFGSLFSAWTPVPFSFLFGFTLKSHIFAVLCGAAVTVCVLLWSRGRPVARPETGAAERPGTGGMRAEFLFTLPFLLLCTVILLNHTIPEEGGALYTGQCTYGDMPMHLGFITSIAAQSGFPPCYSILPGTRLCYPFLCDSISSSLYLLGSSLRLAYLLPSLFALEQVFFGFFMLAEEVLRSRAAAFLAFVFFFLNGGFGTLYFLNGSYSFRDLISGFYVTPTNLTDEGIRWVNVIADMLIPQRATLYGWSMLFAALYLLYGGIFRESRSYLAAAGLIGGLLPMIHTHSFFALGLTAICWMVCSFFRRTSFRGWVTQWLLFGVPAVLLAVPQLLEWTFASVGGNSSFLRIGPDWVNGFRENWLVFWLKNIGPLFLLIPAAYLRLLRTDRFTAAVYSPVPFIFLLGEIVLFQPNPYDNNKLFYISYLFGCLLSADYVLFLLRRIRRVKLRPAVLALLLLLSTNAAVLTLLRETVSGTEEYRYRLFSQEETKAAEFIRSETAADAVFLTAHNHNNTVAVLTGRNIVCGSPSYVFYHGLDYRQALADAESMLSDPDAFESLRGAYGISYVYLSSHEDALGADRAYFDAHCTLVFSNRSVSIYRVG